MYEEDLSCLSCVEGCVLNFFSQDKTDVDIKCFVFPLSWVVTMDPRLGYRQNIEQNVICSIPIDTVLDCDTAMYYIYSYTNFRLFQLFNNETDTFLGYSNMVCETLLSNWPVILNLIVDDFAMISRYRTMNLSRSHFFQLLKIR